MAMRRLVTARDGTEARSQHQRAVADRTSPVPVAQRPDRAGSPARAPSTNVGVTVTKKVLLRLSALFNLSHSAVLRLLGIAFLVWTLVEPTPMPGIAAMTLGHALGTVAFTIYVYLVVRELQREIVRAKSRDPS
jgi:nitrate reductase gamma subunit